MALSEIENAIYKVLRRQQTLRDTPHKPAVVMFSGIPGSGKTTLAQRLARDLGAQYIQNDAARELARQNGIKIFKPHGVSHELARTIFTEDENKLIILDASVDWSWRHTIPFYKGYGAKVIIIRLNINPDEALKRIQKRRRDDMEAVVEIFPSRIEHFAATKKELPADIELTVPFDYEDALQTIRTKITQV